MKPDPPQCQSADVQECRAAEEGAVGHTHRFLRSARLPFSERLLAGPGARADVSVVDALLEERADSR